MDLKETIFLEVETSSKQMRLDFYLSQELEDVSRNFIQKLIKDGNVFVNGKIEKPKYLIKEDDQICVQIPPAKELDVTAQNIPLDILYEDENIIVINKDQEMVVHPAPGNYEGTLVNALLFHCKENLSSINGIIRPGIVHRIDKNTSGVIVIAKDDLSHKNLSLQFKDHSIKREYHMICLGNIKDDEFSIDAPIARNPKDRLKMAIINGGKRAVTHFKVKQRLKGHTYLTARLETGRTHQIRVHISSKGNPLLGDDIYGCAKSKFKLKGQVLHAKVLGFIHPIKNEYMEFESELPDYFKKLLKILE